LGRLSRRAVRAIVVAIAVMALIAIGAFLKRNQALPDETPAASVQVK
jgi:hypothetical protein